MGNKTIDTRQGHWLLAKMGKKVLRPGGKELTLDLIKHLNINSGDDVVEFAPGMGFTAAVALQQHPQSYRGIELNEEAAAILRKKINGKGREIIIGNAAHSTLKPGSATKVYGEAMLTMQADHRKSEIVKEAHRILVKGGFYGIHELGLSPDTMDEELKRKIQRELAQVIRVNARPLTAHEWQDMLTEEGFQINKVMTNPMYLLEPSRVIDDEGILQSIKIAFNVLVHPKALKQIMAMRSVFRKYQEYLCAIAIVAEKI